MHECRHRVVEGEGAQHPLRVAAGHHVLVKQRNVGPSQTADIPRPANRHAGVTFKTRAHVALQDDYARYLRTWEPNTQHSIWLVAGSRWTLPMSKVLESTGERGKVLCQAMKATLARLESGELKIPKRDPGTGGAHLKLVPTLKESVEKWEAKYGKVPAGYPNEI